jgi:hypothetical protein
MMSESPPRWLWRALTWGLGLAGFSVAALAVALSLGAADPPRAGPLLWNEEFTGDLTRWRWLALNGAALAPREGALRAEFTAEGQMAAALTEGPAGDFTLEMTGAQSQGEIGLAYGLVFDWQDEQHYSAILINGNGYAEAYRQAGAEREPWYAWQQWPHILVGAEANRVRVDVRGARVTARVNHEFLVAVDVPERAPGLIGVLARGAGPGQVVFGWVQVWAP